MIAYLDRVNISFANLEMSKDLKFTDTQFGFGAGMFFIGYFLLEIPGAIIVERWSARKWIARIMVSWGFFTALQAFVHTPTQFSTVRFLLGAAEAGFFPGLIVYLTHWFRNEDRAKAVALLMSAIPLSSLIGSPLSGKLMEITWLGLAGWRWLFILEGVPAVIFGVITLFYLTDRPEQAKWLPDDEKEWLTTALAREKAEKAAKSSLTVFQALGQRDVLLLAVLYFCAVTANYGCLFWLPTILKRASNLSNFTVTVISGLPFFVGWLYMMYNGWHSDRQNERRLHVAGPLFVAACALLAAAFAVSGQGAGILWIVLAFTVAIGGISGYKPAFWALATGTLSGSASAAAIGMINSIGNLGGFLGPFLMGYLRSQTTSFAAGIGALAVIVFISVVLALVVKEPAKKPVTE